MATRPDIRDFDVESLLKSFAAAKRKSRKDPSYLKRLAPNLIKGVVGIYDQYQTEKLQDEIDQTNFENTLELAKLNMNAAKNAKLYKATSKQYNQLASQGFNFDEVDKDKMSDAAFAVAQPILGEQAWRETTEKFKTIPQSLTGSYADFEQYVQDYAVSPEAKQNITKFYRAAIRDQANYIKTGQSFNYDKFQAAAESLKAMDIDFDAADYGLLAKLDGRLRRKVRMRDGAIDTFRSTYMSKPAADMDKALSVWRDSRTKDEFNTNIRGLDLGYAAFLTDEQRNLSVGLPQRTKERIRQGMEKFVGDREEVPSTEIQNLFNNLVFGVATPGISQANVAEQMYQQIDRIDKDTRLTQTEKDLKVENIRDRYRSIIEELSNNFQITTDDDVKTYIAYREAQKNSLARIKELESQEVLSDEELIELQDAKDQNALYTKGLSLIGSPEAVAFQERMGEYAMNLLFDGRVSKRGQNIRNTISATSDGLVTLNDPKVVEALKNARGNEELQTSISLGIGADYTYKNTPTSAEAQGRVQKVQSLFTNRIVDGTFFTEELNNKGLTEDLEDEVLLQIQDLKKFSQVFDKGADITQWLQRTNQNNVVLGGIEGAFQNRSVPLETLDKYIPDMLFATEAITYVADSETFIVDPTKLNRKSVVEYYRPRIIQEERNRENTFNGINAVTGSVPSNVTDQDFLNAIEEAKARGTPENVKNLQELYSQHQEIQARSLAEEQEKEAQRLLGKPTQQEIESRREANPRLRNRSDEEIAEMIMRGKELFRTDAPKNPRVRNRKSDKKKVTPEPTSPKETSETNILDAVINTIIPSAEAVIPEKQQTSLLEGNNISKAVDLADERQRNFFSSKREIPVTLSDGTSLTVDTIKPVVYLKNKFDANELTFDQGVEAYAKAIEAHNATLGLSSRANALDPIVDSLTFAALAKPKEYNSRKFMRVASNKKESQNFKDSVFEIVNSEEAQEEIKEYSLKVSDMTEEQKEREFERQAKKAKSIPVNTNNDYARNAIEYLKLQSIFGAENDRALPNLGKEEYGSTVNSKVSQYNDYLENYSPSMDTRLIRIYRQVANNLKSPNKNSLLASN